MERNTLFYNSRLTVNEVIVAKLKFKFNALLITTPLMCLWKLGELVPKFIRNNII